MFQTFLVTMCEFFSFLFCLMFLVWCYYSLSNVAIFILVFCSTFLCLLLHLARCSLLDTTRGLISFLLLLHLARCCCSSYYSLLDIVALLVVFRLMVLPLVQHYYSSCCSFYCSLFNVVTLLATPCLTLLFFYCPLSDTIAHLATLWSTLLLLLLFLGQHCFSTLLGRCCCSFTCSILTQLAKIPLYYVVMFLPLCFLPMILFLLLMF